MQLYWPILVQRPKSYPLVLEQIPDFLICKSEHALPALADAAQTRLGDARSIRYHEFDFQEVASAKARVIAESSNLRALVHKDASQVSVGTFSSKRPNVVLTVVRPRFWLHLVSNILPSCTGY
jgi:hypothetical protein